MVTLTVKFDINTTSYKVAYTILDTMLTRGWEEPWFRDKRVKFLGIVQTPEQCAKEDNRSR